METTGTDDRKAPRVIKRYANRKLYDTRDSRYVTLLQIAEYVRNGEDVAIIDNTTKEDLTSATLAQIVYEAEKNSAETGRPKTMGTLRDLIQNSGERLMSTLREGPMGKLIARREGDADKTEPPAKVERTEVGDEEAAGKAERKNLLLSPKDAIDELQRLADERVNVVLGTAIQSVHQLQSEVKRLHGRIEELEQKLVAVQQRRGANSEDASSTIHRDNERDGSDRT